MKLLDYLFLDMTCLVIRFPSILWEFEAAELIKQGDEAFSLGHNAHADLLTMDANGEISNGYMLLMHAEDQLMSAEAFRILADEFITLYKRIDEK